MTNPSCSEDDPVLVGPTQEDAESTGIVDFLRIRRHLLHSPRNTYALQASVASPNCCQGAGGPPSCLSYSPMQQQGRGGGQRIEFLLSGLYIDISSVLGRTCWSMMGMQTLKYPYVSSGTTKLPGSWYKKHCVLNNALLPVVSTTSSCKPNKVWFKSQMFRKMPCLRCKVAPERAVRFMAQSGPHVPSLGVFYTS